MDASLQLRAEQLAVESAAQARTAEDVSSLIRLMTKATLERMLETEMDFHMGRKSSAATLPELLPVSEKKGGSNRRNGRSRKTVQGETGKLTLATPRDREGVFEPLIVPKHQRRLAGFDDKILALYANGMTTREIQQIVKELYDVDVSPTLNSEITSDLDAEVKTWQTRRLGAVIPILFLDGLVVHIRSESGQVREHTMYVAIGVNLEGKKELLGLWLDETEGAKFWLACLTDLKNRGVQDIFIVCVDGLSGFPEAIQVAYPQAKVQLCIVHLVRRAEVRDDRRQRGSARGSQKDLSRCQRAGSGAGTRPVFFKVGREISDDLQAVTPEVAPHHFDVRNAARDSQSDLYHQCHRIGEQRDRYPPVSENRGLTQGVLALDYWIFS